MKRSSTTARAERRYRRLDLRAALIAGLVAGIVATLAQLLLWLLFTDDLPQILFRDARLAAAIVFGQAVLAGGFDAGVMTVATLVHFTLSLAYGLLLAMLIAPLGTSRALFAGAGFGLALFAVNMYGFTAVFPWFAVARDGITAAAHLVFGVSAAAAYLAARRA